MPATVDIRNTHGALLIGLVVSAVLFGVTIIQTWNYFWCYRGKDRKALQGLVAFVSVLDTVHTILCLYSVYWYLILNFGNIETLDVATWSMNIQVLTNCAIDFSVQLFYARRLYIMSNNIVLPVIISILGAVTFILANYFTAKSFELERYSNFAPLVWTTCVGMGAASLADIIIALSMCWCLWHKRTGFQRTDSIIMSLVSYCISSGLLTSILAIGTLVSFTVARFSLINEAFFWALGKCYVNSFLAILNSRNSLRDRSPNNTDGSFHMSPIRQTKQTYMTGSVPTAVAVSVHRAATTDFTCTKNGYDQNSSSPELVKSEGLSDSV